MTDCETRSLIELHDIKVAGESEELRVKFFEARRAR